MKYSISFPTSLETINSENDNVDVCLYMADGTEYTFVIFTPENLKSLMKKDGVPFFRPCYPFLVVEEITRENIELLIKELVEMGELFLRIYGSDLETVYD